MFPFYLLREKMTEGFNDSYKRILYFLERLFDNGIQNCWPKLVTGYTRHYENSKLQHANVCMGAVSLAFSDADHLKISVGEITEYSQVYHCVGLFSQHPMSQLLSLLMMQRNGYLQDNTAISI
jgi:hypothetical protein